MRLTAHRSLAWRILLLLVTAGGWGCSSEPSPVAELTGPTMGTRYSVQLSPPPETQALGSLQRDIARRLDVANALFSTYVDDSALMRFNRTQATDWQAVPGELVELVRQAAAISHATAGRYDVTVGPLVDLWGFGSAGDRNEPPPDQAIATALARVGYGLLEWRIDPPMLRKSVPDLEIDLSSIAKGWAVDAIGSLLEEKGHRNFLVEIGGETLIRGTKADGSPWRLAIERPTGGTRLPQRILEPGDAAVATSGDYRNFFEHEGRRYGHTIDPRSGQPIRHRVASVTVVAASCTAADAWATALMALGEVDGPLVAEHHEIAALFVIADGDALVEQPTTEFTQRFQR